MGISYVIIHHFAWSMKVSVMVNWLNSLKLQSVIMMIIFSLFFYALEIKVRLIDFYIMYLTKKDRDSEAKDPPIFVLFIFLMVKGGDPKAKGPLNCSPSWKNEKMMTHCVWR